MQAESSLTSESANNGSNQSVESKQDSSATASEYSSENGPSPDENSTNEQKNDDSRFDCNICLDTAKDAVVSMCGHLFCWPCLHQWLDTRPNRPLCPVCKSSISKEKVIPLYGRNGKESDPREKVPPRPQGQRTEEPAQNFPGMFQWGGAGGDGGHGVQFSLGIGVFPISFFASSFFNAGIGADRRPEPPSTGSRQDSEEQFLSNVFLYIGLAFLLWLMFF